MSDTSKQVVDSPGRSVEGSGRPDLERIGRFRLLRQIGWGGMGIVYEAVEETDVADPAHAPRRLALKLLRFTDPSGNALRRFQQEGAAALRLQHPGIVAVHEVGRADAYDFYTMDYIVGREFDDWLATTRPGPRSIVTVMAEVATAVEYAHSRGVLHRDLKPANILVDEHDRAHITDFGLARTIGADSSITGSGQSVGTPAYMSPEQAKGLHKDCGPQSDVWSLGVMLYEALTGTQPFVGDSALDVLHQVVNHDPPLPGRLVNGIAPRLDRIVGQCLEKDPRDRYASAGELAADLERYLQGSSVRARSRSGWRSFRTWRRRFPHSPLGWTGLAALALLGTSAALLITPTTESRPPRTVIATDPDIEWAPLFDWKSDDGPLARTDVALTDGRMRPNPEAWSYRDDGLLMPNNHWLLLTGHPVVGDVRLTLEIEWLENVDGLELALNAQPDPEDGTLAPIGYLAQIGGFAGAVDVINVNRRPRFLSFAGGSASAAAGPGTVQEVVFERTGDRLRLLVDGQESMALTDTLPVGGTDLAYAGVRCWVDRGILIRRIRLERAIGSDQHPAIAAIDTLLRNGRIKTAIVECEDLIRIVRDTDVRSLARLRLASMILSSSEHPHEQGIAALDALIAEHPDSVAAATALTMRASWLWSESRFEEALRTVEDCLDRDPDSEAVRRILIDHPGHLPEDPALLRRSLNLFVRDRDLGALQLGSTGIEDLTPLKGTRLRMLSIERNRISDLSPLADLPLRHLDCSGNRIGSLAPLSSMQLHRLRAADNRIADLRPLAGMQFDLLDLSNNPLTSVAGLENVTVDHLVLDGCPLTDIDALDGQRLLTLLVKSTSLTNISALSGTRFTFATFKDSPITDLQPAINPDLEWIDASGTSITHIPDLRTASRLSGISVADTPLTDCTALALACPAHVDISRTPLTSLAGIDAGGPEYLTCDYGHLRDLGTLPEGRLRRLSSLGTRLPIGELLRLGPEVEVQVAWDASEVPDVADLDRLISTWSALPTRSATLPGLRQLRAVLAGDHAALAAHSVLRGPFDTATPPLLVDLAEARAIAGRHPDWRLPTHADAQDLRDAGYRGGRHWLEGPDGVAAKLGPDSDIPLGLESPHHGDPLALLLIRERPGTEQ